MTSTRSAAATGLPALRFSALPELEGTALRLHVSPVVTARWPSGDRGYALLSLCPGDDPDEPAALVRLPLAQAGALARACAAFNVILAAGEREAERHQFLTPDATQPVDGASTLSKGIGSSSASASAKSTTSSPKATISSSKEITPHPTATPMPGHSPHAVAPRAQGLVTAAAQVAILAGFLPVVAARCLGLL